MAITQIVQSARTIDAASIAKAASIPAFMVSADSHATEPDSLWKDMPSKLRDQLPLFKGRANRPVGATDPKERIKDMDKDKVSAEVLYPDRGLGTFVAVPEVQELSFHLYNEWLADYCKYSPKRLFGITAVSCYDIDKAIKEMQRGHDLGLHGVLIWEVPDPRLPFSSPHYEKLWSAAEELGEPINLHILTGFLKKPPHADDTTERIRINTNARNDDTLNALFDFIWTGVFERHPKLKLGMIESEIGWAPFMLQQWDYYYERALKTTPEIANFKMSRKPSEVFNDHVFATFMDDYYGTHQLSIWGQNNCMWSSDYPHPNMTWPDSRAFVAKQISELSRPVQNRLLSENVIGLYNLDVDRTVAQKFQQAAE